MIKYFCDCCEKETLRLYEFSYYVHLSPDRVKSVIDIYTDADGNRISGRQEGKGLCIRCYNNIMSKAIAEYIRIQNEQ